MHTLAWSVASFFVGTSAGIAILALVAARAPVRAAKIKAREENQ